MKPGDVVSLKGRKKTAKVKFMLTDVEGGVLLEDYLGGHRYWNVLDLRVIRYDKRKKEKTA